MDQKLTDFAELSAPAHPQIAVSFLQCRTTVQVDPEPVDYICNIKGFHETEELICRVLENIALRLDALQIAKQNHAFDDVVKPARRIVQVAMQIGLTEVSCAAGHVGVAAHAADGVALGAVMARLERGFDLAVSEIWNFRDRHAH